MLYADASDLFSLYGADALSAVADRDGDYKADSEAMVKALRAASAEIGGYVATRYPLPLPVVPEHLKQIACDIAIYRMATSASALTEEHRTRYDDAIKFLRDLAAGKAALVLPEEGAAGASSPSSNSPRPVLSDGPPRQFSREKTRGL